MDEEHMLVGEPVGLKSLHIMCNELGGRTLYLASNGRQVSMILSTRVNRDAQGQHVVTKNVNDMSLLHVV